MEKFVKGDVVIVPFPFSDLTQSKKRPALVLAALEGDDLVLCQITSQSLKDKYAISLDEKDFSQGSLKQKSYIRPSRIFTADHRIVLYGAGRIRLEKITTVIQKLVSIFQ